MCAPAPAQGGQTGAGNHLRGGWDRNQCILGEQKVPLTLLSHLSSLGLLHFWHSFFLYSRLASSLWFSCHRVFSAGITGVYEHAQHSWLCSSQFYILYGIYVMMMLGNGVAHISRKVQNRMAFHHRLQSSVQAKTYELLIHGLVHVIFLNCAWLYVTEAMEREPVYRVTDVQYKNVSFI